MYTKFKKNEIETKTTDIDAVIYYNIYIEIDLNVNKWCIL